MDHATQDKNNWPSAEAIKQYPSAVIDFSSQYGSERGSYSAVQLVGSGPTVYPRYGDFCEACVLRYYGPWWSKAPSAAPPIGCRPDSRPPSYCSEDFVEVEYAQPVYLLGVRVYETFIPGCIVAIYAGCWQPPVGGSGDSAAAGFWHLVWRRPAPSREPHASRIFKPPPDECRPAPPLPVNRLRLEFNSRLAQYYTEVDTVELIGTLRPNAAEADSQRTGPNSLADKIDSLKLDPGPNPSTSDMGSAGWFSQWPNELLSRVLSYLDLRSLLRLGQTCRLLEEFCNDPLLYRSLSLRPYCLRISDAALLGLAQKLTSCRHLELSWCSGISSAAFSQLLLASSGSRLTALRLASCAFLDDACLAVIGSHCRLLKDLDLSGCRVSLSRHHPVQNNQQPGYAALAKGLTRLRRLNLYRCGIGFEPLKALLQGNPDLRHLNLGACPDIFQYGNEICQILGSSCRLLRSLDFWRNRCVGSQGLDALGNGCPRLQELDIGWCPGVKAYTGCLADLASRCTDLRKLFLTANRTVRDVDLAQIAKHCRELRQLDILGSNHVSASAMHQVLKSCPRLEMFDVSFCGQIRQQEVEDARREYPNCTLQKSFQNVA